MARVPNRRPIRNRTGTDLDRSAVRFLFPSLCSSGPCSTFVPDSAQHCLRKTPLI